MTGPVRALRAEREYRRMANRMIDYMVPGARARFRYPLWRAALARMVGRRSP